MKKRLLILITCIFISAAAPCMTARASGTGSTEAQSTDSAAVSTASEEAAETQNNKKNSVSEVPATTLPGTAQTAESSQTSETSSEAGTTTPAPSTGWGVKDGRKIYILDDGTLATGLQDINEETYYFDADGYMVSGWIAADDQNPRDQYYFSTETGVLIYKILVSSVRSGSYYTAYAYDKNGKKISGWIRTEDRTYFCGGTDRHIFHTWSHLYNDLYNFGDDGIMLTGWQTIGKNVYYFGDDGRMAKGWKTIDGSTYFFSTSDGHMFHVWSHISGRLYYFGNDGKMVTGWQTIGKNTYYFDTGGRMVTGWKTIDGSTYFFSTSDGHMYHVWSHIGKNVYYFGDDGKMVRGWKTINGSTYFFSTSDGHMYHVWSNINGNIYYFGNDGKMVTGWQTIGGKQYFFNSRGVLQKNVSSSGVRLIDVSYFQGNINWTQVRNAGVEAVIIRAGYGSWSGKTFKTVTDAKFSKYIKGAEAAGLKIGIYWFSEATTVAQARTEARKVLQLISGHKISLPVYFDWEDYSYTVAKKHGVTVTKANGKLDAMTLAFCSTISAKGYRAGWYANNNYYRNKYNPSKLSAYSFWYAQYGVSKPSVSGMDLWQYGQKKINGITGSVDVNRIYSSSLIK